jgi:tetratricopeptide (TPR) repeat protein
MACLEEAGKIEVTPDKVNLHAILLCRLAIFLLRGGLPALAHGLYAEAKRLIAGKAVALVTQAWCEAARAEVALQKGDVAAHIRCVEASVTSFTAAGDLRNACVSQARAGDGYMQFGAYRRAAAVLEELLRVAEPMNHEVAVQAKVSQGMALARLDQLDQALEVESTALKNCLEQGERAQAGRARTYLATILLMRGEVRSAEHVARQALETLGDKTAGRALALGTLASIKLAQSQPALALVHSREAVELVGQLGDLKEGEPMIRAAYALSLRAAGREAEARDAISAAQAKLLERADRIRDPEWRARFLGAVPENARVVDLATHWDEAS